MFSARQAVAPRTTHAVPKRMDDIIKHGTDAQKHFSTTCQVPAASQKMKSNVMKT